jgi:hypothetical protein
MLIRRLTVCLSVCSLAIFVIGCDVGGGASVVPKVTVKLGDTEIAVVDDAGADQGGEDNSVAGFGTFKGKVVLEGAAPTLSFLVTKGSKGKDWETCAAVGIPDERLLAGTGNGVKNVFIYLSKTPRGAPKTEVPAEAARFDQKGCQFLPHCLLVRKGQDVLILSDDPIAHNTHTYPAKNTPFNSGIPANDRVGTKIVYTSAESKPFAVKCDYHTWMNAYHLPLDHPYAAITAADGSFEIKDIPSGKHNFVIWHEGVKGGYLQRKHSVTIKADEATEETIPYPISKFSP